jgi:hypothetical protein
MNENLDSEEFGGLPSLEKLKLLAEWAPVIAKLQAVLAAESPSEKAQAFVKFALAVAQKTPTHADDEALEHLQSILSTPSGVAACNWLAKLIGGLA